jgi:hypothetical protein
VDRAPAKLELEVVHFVAHVRHVAKMFDEGALLHHPRAGRIESPKGFGQALAIRLPAADHAQAGLRGARPFALLDVEITRAFRLDSINV